MWSCKQKKSDSIALKGEVDKLKAQVNVEVEKKIIELEAKVELEKMAYENLNKDNVTLHKVIKDF